MANKKKDTNNEPFNNGEKKYSDSLKFARRCLTFSEFKKLQDETSEPDLSNTGNKVE